MAIISYSLSIAGTACPWAVGSLSSNVNGSSGIIVAYNTPYYDGSQTGGGSAGQNAAYPYGKSHTHAGETGPTTLSVTPGQIVFLKYISGIINTQGSGATSCGPAGAATTTVTPYPSGGCDNTTFPTNVIPGYGAFNANGVVSTSGTTVTWVSGTKFNGRVQGLPIWINSVQYTISIVTSPTSITLSATAGTQTSVNWFFWGARTNMGGIVGAFTDASGNIISTFDWASWGGVNPAGAFTLTSVTAGGAYNGTITNGGSNAFAGYWFTITGCTNTTNNGTFYCTASSTATLTLVNPAAVAETHAASAQQLSGITLRVPVGATTLSLGINDTVLYDNTGSFSITAVVMDALGWVGSADPFVRYGIGPSQVPQPAFGFDQYTKLQPTRYLTVASPAQTTWGQKKLLPDWVGQLFPRGKN
jgi:hypothetical protein